MVTRLIAQLLLRRAARRWPPQYLPEWLAELHVMAADDRRFAMLRYAASLALSRPATRPRDALSMTAKACGTAAMVLMAPVAAVVLGVSSLIIGERIIGEALQGVVIDWFVIADVFPELRTGQAEAWLAPTALVLVCVSAVVTRVLSPMALPTGPTLTAVLLLGAVLPPLLWAEWDTQTRNALGAHGAATMPTPQYSGIIFWAGGMALVLIGVAHLSRYGRSGLAWIAGAGGALLLLDLCAVVSAESLAVALADFSWLPWVVKSEWNGNYTAYLLMCSGYLLGYAIGVARTAPADRHTVVIHA